MPYYVVTLDNLRITQILTESDFSQYANVFHSLCLCHRNQIANLPVFFLSLVMHTKTTPTSAPALALLTKPSQTGVNNHNSLCLWHRV